MRKSVIAISIALGVLLIIAVACGSKTGTQSGSSNVPTGKVIKTVQVGNNLTATLSNDSGVLKHGNQEFTISFTDSSGKLVDVGAMSLNFHMDQMGTMAAMNDSVTFTTTSTPGICRGKVNIESGGEWQAQLAYEGPAGKGKTTFSVAAQ